tara:strand:+ start:5291 stop:5539 length:249 start_codon:yes stop_codon:yes gene_type:complete
MESISTSKYLIVREKYYPKFKEKVEKYLNSGWILHGYTQHPLETDDYYYDKTLENGEVKEIVNRNGEARKGQWSQAFIKLTK